MNAFFYTRIFTPCASSKNLFYKVRTFLELNGHRITEDIESADYIFINTCGFLESIEKELIKDIRHYSDTYQKQIVIFWCLGSISKELKTIPNIAFIIRVGEEDKFDDLFWWKVKYNTVPVLPRKMQEFDKINSFVLSTWRWCIHNCSFCATKRAIGHIKSIPMEIIKENLLEWIKQGYKNFFLTWDDIASYGRDLGYDFADLFELLVSADESTYFTLDHMETSWLREIFQKLEPHMHRIIEMRLPVQSFSDRKLSLMNRKYTSQEYLDLVSMIKNSNNDVKIINYIIYWYPTETDEEFMRELKWTNFTDRTVFFPYSERPYTKKFLEQEKLNKSILVDRIKKVLSLEKYNPDKFIAAWFYWSR